MSSQLPVLLEKVVYEGGCFQLPRHKVISVHGPDAKAFLSNQTTNNINNLVANSFHLDSVLDISAKLIGFFHLLKESDERFYILVHEELATAVLERLEKYLVAEDVELAESDQKAFGTIGTKALKFATGGFRGRYAEEDVVFQFGEPTGKEIDQNTFHTLKVVTGYPVWKETVFELELINNTRLIDLAYDKDKGCFLGQETVAKIETRRGAAFKPVILECEKKLAAEALTAIKSGGKKIGKTITQANGYSLAALNRESRIEGLEIQIDGPQALKAKVRYLPLYKKEQKAEVYYHHGVEKFTEGDENDAELFLLRAIDSDPTYEDPYESLGVLYGRQERFEEAIEYMQKLSELNPKSVMAHTNMSLYYMKVGEIEKAEEQKSQATIKQFEALGEEAENKRRLEEEEKRKKAELEKRESMFREVLDIDPEDTLASYGLGEIEYLKGNYQQSIEHLQRAIEHKKNYSVAWLALGKSFLASGEKKKAEETFRKGIEVAGKNGDLMPANEMQRLLGTI